MRTLLFIVFAIACSVQIIVAGDPIAFSPTLTSSWVVRTNRAIPEQGGISGHIVVIQNTNQTKSITAMLMRYREAKSQGTLEQEARNHFGGFIQGVNGEREGTITRQRFAVKKAKGREFAEATCQINSSSGCLYFYGNCWFSTNGLISWAAMGEGTPVVGDKEILAIGRSIQTGD